MQVFVKGQFGETARASVERKMTQFRVVKTKRVRLNSTK
jgi:hypothetical protein